MIGRKVTLLGGFGFIGAHLAQQLQARGHQVTVFGHANTAVVERLSAHGIRTCQGDFADSTAVGASVIGAHTVFHLVGSTTPGSSNANIRQELAQGLLPTLSLLDICVESGVEQVVFTSSGGTVYGIPEYVPIDEKHATAPICAYGINKLTTEHYMRLYAKTHGIAMTVARLSNPYGPYQNIRRGQGIIGTYCDRIVKGHPLLVWGDGAAERDYIYIQDVVTALELLIGRRSGFEVFNIGTGAGTSINGLIEKLRAVAARPFEVQYLPGRHVDVPVNILDCTLFRSEFGWAPACDVPTGIGLTLDWFSHVQSGAESM